MILIMSTISYQRMKEHEVDKKVRNEDRRKEVRIIRNLRTNRNTVDDTSTDIID